MASQTQNIANAIVQQFFPTFLAHDNFFAFYFFCGINILLALFVWFFIPETKNVRLEETDVLFGGQNHIENGGKIMGVDDAHHATVDTEKGDVSINEKIGTSHVEEVSV